MKNGRKGQAAIWDSNVIRKMRSRLKSPQQRLIFEISLFTGERVGAICQLKISDIYAKNGSVLDTITFAGRTRKGSKHGSANTRQVPIHPDLLHHLERYQPVGFSVTKGLPACSFPGQLLGKNLLSQNVTAPKTRRTPDNGGYLFPSNSTKGHITSRAVDKYWRKILLDQGFTGFSTHSSRRWVINSLKKAGISIVTIGETMGMNIATVRHYLDSDPAEVSRAIATLTP
jgi:integrase/recombinase XerD